MRSPFFKLLEGGVAEKILSGAFIKAYFYHFAAGIYIGYGKIAEGNFVVAVG